MHAQATYSLNMILLLSYPFITGNYSVDNIGYQVTHKPSLDTS